MRSFTKLHRTADHHTIWNVGSLMKWLFVSRARNLILMVLIQILKARADRKEKMNWWPWRILGEESHSSGSRFMRRKECWTIMIALDDKSIIKLLFGFETIFADFKLSQREYLFPQSSLSYGNFFQFQLIVDVFFVSMRAMLKAKTAKKERMERNEMCKSCERKLNTNCYDIWEAMERWSTRWRLWFVPHFGLQNTTATTTNFSLMSHNFNFLS